MWITLVRQFSSIRRLKWTLRLNWIRRFLRNDSYCAAGRRTNRRIELDCRIKLDRLIELSRRFESSETQIELKTNSNELQNNVKERKHEKYIYFYDTCMLTSYIIFSYLDNTGKTIQFNSTTQVKSTTQLNSQVPAQRFVPRRRTPHESPNGVGPSNWTRSSNWTESSVRIDGDKSLIKDK